MSEPVKAIPVFGQGMVPPGSPQAVQGVPGRAVPAPRSRFPVREERDVNHGNGGGDGDGAAKKVLTVWQLLPIIMTTLLPGVYAWARMESTVAATTDALRDVRAELKEMRDERKQDREDIIRLKAWREGFRAGEGK